MKNAIKYKVTVPLGVESLRLPSDDLASTDDIRGLEVIVVYTTDTGTQKALETAWALAQDLRACVRLVFIYPVPYALPLTAPAVSVGFLQDKLAKLASGFSREASVNIYLCRDSFQALQDVLPELSPVVLGGRKRWWPTKEQRLEKRLKRLGHQVIFAKAR